MHTIHAFHRSESKADLIVCLPEDQHDYWMDLCYKYKFHVPHFIASAGESRFQSVKSGLKFIQENPKWSGDIAKNSEKYLISIHDGVRPLVSSELIDLSFRQAALHRAVVPGLPSNEAIRILNPDRSSSSIERDRVIRVQTPQVFSADILLRAYAKEERPSFTDDASVVELSGFPITIFEGEPTNIKITHAQDLNIAMMYLQKD